MFANLSKKQFCTSKTWKKQLSTNVLRTSTTHYYFARLTSVNRPFLKKVLTTTNRWPISCTIVYAVDKPVFWMRAQLRSELHISPKLANPNIEHRDFSGLLSHITLSIKKMAASWCSLCLLLYLWFCHLQKVAITFSELTPLRKFYVIFKFYFNKKTNIWKR